MSEVEQQALEPVEVSSAAPETAEQGENQQQPAVNEVEQAEPQKDEEAERKQKGLSKRFSELTQQRREAEARAARAEQEAEELRKRLEATAKAEGGESAPKLEDFETYDEYNRAVARWEARETLRQEQKRLAEEQYRTVNEQKQAALQAEYQAKADIARTKYADFDAVAFRQDVPVSQPMVDAILYSEMGAELQYHFGKNPEDAARIARMSPPEALLAIGRLEAQLQTQPAAKATSAPAPISPVNARAAAQKTPDEMTDEEYYAWRRQQNSQRKRF